MRAFTSKKRYLRRPEKAEAFLPVASLMFLLLAVLIGKKAFTESRTGASFPSRDSVIFHVTLSGHDHLAELVEEATGRRLSSLHLIPGPTAPGLLGQELKRVQRKYASLEAVLVKPGPDLSSDELNALVGALQVPPSAQGKATPLVLLPAGGQ